MRGTLHSTFKSFPEARDYAKRMFMTNRERLATWVEEVPRGYGVFFLRTSLNPPQRFPTKKAGAFRMEKSHAFIGKGLVYCPVYRESAAPTVTHSRVKCGLCRETIQSATNPPIQVGWKQEGGSLISHIGDTTYQIVRKSDENIYETYFVTYRGSMKKESGSLGVSRTVNDAMAKAERHSMTGNPILKGRKLSRPTAHMRRSFKRNPAVSPDKSPLAHQLKAEMMGGKTPASALKAVARRFAGRVPRAAILGTFKAVRDELVGGFEGDRATLADWAGMAGMRMHGYRKFSKNMSRNPVRKAASGGAVEAPRLIYGRATSLSFGPDGKVTQMTARKTSGPYKKKDFVHDFKPGVKHIGLPRGTAVTTPDGQTFKMKTRTALMVGPKNLWADFQA